MRAFEAGALDYLLKPFGNTRFDRALERAKERIAQGHIIPRPRETLVIKSVGEISFLKISNIDWIEASGYYCRLHLGNKSHLLRRPIADLERELAQADFRRIHRSTIVNLERIDGLRVNEIGESDVLLRDGTRLRTSRRYQKRLRSLLSLRDAKER